MHVRTVNLIVGAPRDTVFNFLADVENLPKWAHAYCERVYLQRGRWWALTSQGELMVATEVDPATGVIDVLAGVSADGMGLLPIRVLALPAERTLVSLTLVQPPEMSDERYERRYLDLVDETRGLVQRFGGDRPHTGAVETDLAGHGAN
ncbi:MAG: hypothetical protein HYV95_15000 [Opitutae bacterium]|nr:hypothetical protein [Opitutae bacterium]